MCVCVSVSLLSIFDVFHCQLWIKVGLYHKSTPDAFKQEPRLMLLAALIIIVVKYLSFIYTNIIIAVVDFIFII